MFILFCFLYTFWYSSGSGHLFTVMISRYQSSYTTRSCFLCSNSLGKTISCFNTWFDQAGGVTRLTYLYLDIWKCWLWATIWSNRFKRSHNCFCPNVVYLNSSEMSISSYLSGFELKSISYLLNIQFYKEEHY